MTNTYIATIKTNVDVYKVFEHGEDDYSIYSLNGDWSERGTYEDIMKLIGGAILNER